MADWVIVIGFVVIGAVGAFVALLALDLWHGDVHGEAVGRRDRDYDNESRVARERLRGRKERV